MSKPVTIIVPVGTELNIIKEEEQIKEIPLPTMVKTEEIKYINVEYGNECILFFDETGKMIHESEYNEWFIDCLDNVTFGRNAEYFKFTNISAEYDMELVSAYIDRKNVNKLSDLDFAKE